MGEYFLGIDLGGTNLVVGLLDSEGEIRMQQSQPTPIERGPEFMIERLGDVCRKLAEKCNISFNDIKGAGIGSPGPLSIKEGKIIKAGNLPGFDNFPLRDKLSEELQKPAILDNDANAACWGEFWQGAGKEISDMVMFTLGTGIGGGIICNGELIHGHDDNGAELGHMIVYPEGRECNCGQKGCLEAYASASNTAVRAMEALEGKNESAMAATYRKKGTLSCKDIFDHAKAGDELANEIVDGTCRALAVACVNVLHTTEPEKVVLAGGMVNAGEMLSIRVKKFFSEMIWQLKSESLDISLATLGGNAGVVGAAGLAWHYLK